MTRPIVHRAVAANGVQCLSEIKNIIAVASGKGGVGKSTVALNLALALQKTGANVGLLDADIYGPSQPLMLGVAQKAVINENKRINPVMAFGLQTMSIGYLIEAQTPAVWRGPMVSGALLQMLNSTAWDDLDYLIVDLPPGTGDVQLTLAQKVPVCGAVVVTTPQEVALIDVEKAIGMFERVKIPILGVVENMASHVCSHCGHMDAIFGADGGTNLAKMRDLPLLGKVPLNAEVCEHGDNGQPIVASAPGNPVSIIFVEIAKNLSGRLAKLKRDLKLPATSIVIE